MEAHLLVNKKKQKNLLIWPLLTIKSFLLLFFKKEALAFAL
jgi:hypothetical protein